LYYVRLGKDDFTTSRALEEVIYTGVPKVIARICLLGD
jgi:hypothetical protein